MGVKKKLKRMCSEVAALMKYRLEKDLTYERMARELDVSWVTVWNWEKGKSHPTPITRASLLRFLREAGKEKS